jgi:hypothetical protein
MAFFRQAKEGEETVDDMVDMAELERAAQIRIQESPAWERHQDRHKDAQLVSMGEDGDVAVKQKKDDQDAPKISYNEKMHMLRAVCNCGQGFELDVKNDTVKETDPNLKMKDLDPYDKNRTEYEDGQQRTDYNRPDMKPKLSYNSSENGLKYKN